MRIEVDCERIRHNAAAIVQMCAPSGIEVVGVTKACCGLPEVARAMLAGGVSMLGDSRLDNVRRLREAGVDADIMLLRLPTLSEAEDVVRLTQVSLNSELETVRVLSRAALRQGVTHRVILMLDMGDRREGVMPEHALEVAREISQLESIELVGTGASFACFGGVMPTRENMGALVEVTEQIERALGVQFQVISGGQTANLDLVRSGELPRRVNQLRIGEAILLGSSVPPDNPLPCPYQDAFTVVAEVIEIQTKPSLPGGPVVVDSFGRRPRWEDAGLRRRAILAGGEQDMRVDGLRPRRPGVTILGASSDYLILDVSEAHPPVHVGEELEFDLRYAALATAMASIDVRKVFYF